MKRVLSIAAIIIVCMILQCTVFETLAIASIVPNLMIIVVASFAILRGQREGLLTGFFTGILMDLVFGNYIGMYALIYLLIGFVMGYFKQILYPEEIKIPLLLIAISDLLSSIIIYIAQFAIRGRTDFKYYLGHIILPELAYTMVIAVLLYFIILKINDWLEEQELRSEKKID